MKRISGFISSLKEVYLGTLTSEDESEPFDQYEVLPYSNQQAKKDKKHKDKDKEHKDGKEKDKQKHIGKKLNDAFERQMEKIEKKLMKKKEKDEEMTIKYSHWCAVVEKKTKSLIDSIHGYNKLLESQSSSSAQPTTIFGQSNNSNHPMSVQAKQIVAVCEDLIGYLEMSEAHIIFSSGTHTNSAIYATNTPTTAIRTLQPDEFDTLTGNNLKYFRNIRELFTELWCLVLEPHNAQHHGINNLIPQSKESPAAEEEDKKEKKGRARVSTSANTVVPSAPIPTSKPRSASASTSAQGHKSKGPKTISFLEKLSKTDSYFSDTDVAIVYKLLTVIMRRREFDNKHLQLNTQNIPTCPESDLQCFRKYRTLLYATQAYITRKIVKSMGCHSFYKRFQLNVFCARILAITFFRIPEMSDHILQAIAMDPAQATKLAETLAKIDKISNKDLSLLKLNDFAIVQESKKDSSNSPLSENNNNNNSPHDSKDRRSLERSIEQDPLRGASTDPLATEDYNNHLTDFKLKIAKSNYPTIFGWKVFHEALSDSQSFIPSATPLSFSPETPDEKEAPTLYTVGSRIPKKKDAPLIIYNLDNSVKVIDPANSKSPNTVRRSYDLHNKQQQNSSQRTIDKYDLSVSPKSEKEKADKEQTEQPTAASQPQQNNTLGSSDEEAISSTSSDPSVDPLSEASATASASSTSAPVTAPGSDSPKPVKKHKHKNHKANAESAVNSQNNNNGNTEPEKKTETWILILRNNDAFFYFFLKEFVLYIYNVVTQNHKLPDASHFDWTFVDGYTIFARHLVSHLLDNESWSRPLLDASCSLLFAQPTLINLYMKILFQRTNALHIPSVMDCLATLEIWFKHFINNKTHLPANFDSSYLASCIQILFDFDHHQIVSRIISVIYNNSDVFAGTPRKGMFLDFLIKRNFFNLFLHWDDNIRNAFHQLLVFKACRVRRSLLAAEGIHVDELASADANVSKVIIASHTPVIIRDYMGNEIVTEPATHNGAPTSPSQPQQNATENNSTEAANLETVETRPRKDSRPVNVRVNSFIQKRDLNKSVELEEDLTDPQQNQERENFLDTVVFAKIESFVRIIQEQLRDKNIKAFDKELEVYVPRALSEYKLYLSRYYAWERSGETEPPKLVPMHLLNVMRDD